MVFFIVEKFVRIIRGDDSHSHSYSHTLSDQKLKQSDVSEGTTDNESEASQKKVNSSKKKKNQKAEIKHKEAVVPRIRVAAYLNLVADLMHNFTDGLAIGASFIAGSTVGLGYQFVFYVCFNNCIFSYNDYCFGARNST